MTFGSRRNKKGELTLSDMIFWIINIVIVGILAFMFYGAFKTIYEQKLDTNKIDHYVWSNKIMHSLSYFKSRRTQEGVIDYEKFNEEDLQASINLPITKYSKNPVFKVKLSSLDGQIQKEIYSDKPKFEDAWTLRKLEYAENNNKLYVLIKKDNTWLSGILEITELYPI